MSDITRKVKDLPQNKQLEYYKSEYERLLAKIEVLKVKVDTLESLLKSKETGFSQNPNGFGKINPLEEKQ